jgi:protein-L-isoaspartate(D-aspartate) O-methyltransferase
LWHIIRARQVFVSIHYPGLKACLPRAKKRAIELVGSTPSIAKRSGFMGHWNMIDYEAQRVKMVDNQVRTTDVTSHSVLSAFLTVPRENFVPDSAKPLAYVDSAIELKVGSSRSRYLPDASPIAKLLQLAAISKEDKVLEVGAGTGYISALLSLLAGTVVSLESDEELAEASKANLAANANVKVVVGDLEKGAAADGPYDLIFVDGAVEVVPETLFGQLKDGGRLVAVIGYGNSSRAHLFFKERGTVSAAPEFNTAIKPLPGFRKAAEFQF